MASRVAFLKIICTLAVDIVNATGFKFVRMWPCFC